MKFLGKRSVVHGSFGTKRIEYYLFEPKNVFVNRRLNVLKKIIVPRTNASVVYIISELEELAREEFHRLKKIKEKKKKNSKKKHDHEGHFCPICNKRDDKTENVLGNENPAFFFDASRTNTEITTESVVPISPTVPAPQITVIDTDVNSKLIFVQKRLTDVITISKSFIERGIDSFDVSEFLRICETAKIKIDQFFDPREPAPELSHNINEQFEKFKCNLRDIVDVTKEFKKEGFPSASIDKLLKACEIVNNQLNEVHQKIDDEKSNDKVNEFKAHLDDVMQMTQDYTSEGLLSPDVDEYLKSFSIIKAKFEGKSISTLDIKDSDEDKLNHLKNHISELEELTVDIEQNRFASSSIEKFKSACKQFKIKIEEDREKLQAKKALNELSGHIDDTVGIGKQAQKEGLLGDSIEDFIKSIGDVKNIINPEGVTEARETEKKPTVLDALKTNIEHIIKSLTKIKSANLVSVSVDDLLKSCEIAKAKIDVYQKYSPVSFKKRIVYPDCSEHCICERENVSVEQCEKCQNMGGEMSFAGAWPAPCDSCSDSVKERKSSETAVCSICSRPYEEDILLPEQSRSGSSESSNICEVCELLEKEKEKQSQSVSPEPSDICEVCELLKKEKEKQSQSMSPEPSDICEVCESLKKEEQKETNKEEEHAMPTVDSSLGYFEKKIRKITKVKRSQNPDGTIREEKETITVRQEKHDPNVTSLLDDDEYDVSYESLLDDDNEKQIAVCSTPNENQRGFLYFTNKAKSEILFRVSPMATPILKHCISYNVVKEKDSFLLENDSCSIELDFCSLDCMSNISPDSRNL